MPRYHRNGNVWQHVYFFVIPTTGAMLLASFIIMSYRTRIKPRGPQCTAVSYNIISEEIAYAD